jgi:hypothetical protein
VRRPVAALVCGGLTPHSCDKTQLRRGRQVATDQSADKSAHSKELTLPLDQSLLKNVRVPGTVE